VDLVATLLDKLDTSLYLDSFEYIV
jgi:hypothetical protein